MSRNVPKSTTNSTKNILKTSLLATAGAAVTLLGGISPANAQRATETLIQEIQVIARKKSNAEAIQDVPVAISAFSGDQLEALHVQDLQDLSFSMPNVVLEDVGTLRGTANFAIRGLGINSSIPSIDPTVGVFVDGVYLGINSGVVMDVFDLEGIEVLRGPQGLLFGRNVTGGAVLLKTRLPGDEVEGRIRVKYETGPEYSVAGSIGGPISDQIRAKVMVYYNDDAGWHTNLFNGNNDLGANDTLLIRPAIVADLSERIELILRYEHGEANSDGAAGQNRGLFDRNSFDISIDEEGNTDQEWDQFTAEANVDVDFGDGTITNIFGWREYDSVSLADVDSTPSFLFHAEIGVGQKQFSNELRYAGSFNDVWDITAGVYFFDQEIDYLERRIIPPVGLDAAGGGIQDQKTFGIFTQSDIDLTDQLTATLGIRYTDEKKSVQVANVLAGLCNFSDRTAKTCLFDVPVPGATLNDSESWSNVTPKVGLDYSVNDDLNFYGFWTRGFRSGGYNLRNTSFVFAPGPFNEEKQDSFEVGMKSDWADGRLRLNIAAFYNEIDDLQRELNLSDPVAGVVQITQNTAKARVKGFEADMQMLVAEGVLITAQVGHVDGDYKDVIFDISSDGVIDENDLALSLPRLAPWTYGVTAVFDTPVGDLGTLTAQVGFNHRDSSAFTDNNIGFFNAADMVDASISFLTADEHIEVSVYGRNLANEVVAGGDSQLPFFPGATFSPLNEGRVWGVEANYRF